MLRSHHALLLIGSLGVVGASLALTTPAFSAEPTAADSETALQLYKDGKALREKGEAQAALTKLRGAYALVQTPIIALELGRTYAALGQLVEARGILLGVARLPVRSDESTKAAEARADSETLAAELRPRLGSLTIRPRGTAEAPPVISVDGVVVPSEAATAPRYVNPGSHVIVLEANGKRSQIEVTLTDGQSRDVDIDVPVRDVVPPPPSEPRALTPPPNEPDHKTMSPLVYAGFGAAIVGIGVGTVMGIVTLSKASSLKDTCRDGHCPPSSQSDLDSASTTGAISTVAFVIGAAGAAVGVVGLVIGGKSEPARTGFHVTPTVNGFRGAF